MSDNADRAAEIEQLQRDHALANHKRKRSQPKEYLGIRVCMECGEDIPESRVKALPEAFNCIYCQSQIEHNQKNYRK